MKENNDAIENKVTPLAVLTTNMGIQAVMEEPTGSFIFHLSIISKTSWNCHDSRDQRNSKIYSRSR